MPAHPELEPPATIRINSYSVLEHSGIVWVNTEDDVKPVSLPDNLTAVRSLTFDCALEQAVEAFTTVSLSDDPTLSLSHATVCEHPRVLSFNTTPGTADRTSAQTPAQTSTMADGIWIAFQPSALYTNSSEPLPDTPFVVCHVLAADTMTGAELVAVSRWCESARRCAEADTLITSKGEVMQP